MSYQARNHLYLHFYSKVNSTNLRDNHATILYLDLDGCALYLQPSLS